MLAKIKSHYSNFIDELKSLFNQENGLKPFFFIVLTYVIGYFSLIRANIYYLDDLRRMLLENVGWEGFSRYSSNFLARWLNMNNGADLVTLDISPLSQFIALTFLAITSLILLRIFKVKAIYTSLLATASIGLSPFFLENMSYKMDAPYMAIAILGATFPFLYLNNKKLFSFVGILSLLVMYTTYQPANAVYILIAIFLFLDKYIETKNIKSSFEILLSAFIIFVVATLIYKFLILTETDSAEYVSSHILSADKFFSGIFSNLSHYFFIFYDNFKETILCKLVLFAVFSLPIIIYFYKKSLLPAIITAIVIVISTFASYGLYAVLDKPLFAARALNGIGTLVALVLLLAIKYSDKIWKALYKLITMFIAYNLLVISFVYGNELLAQYQFDEFRANALIYQLNMKYKYIKNYSIYIDSGRYDKIIAPRTELAIKSFPVLNMLIQTGNQGHWLWTAKFNYLGKVNYNFVISPCADSNNNVVEVLDTDIYTAKVYDNKCLVVTYHQY